MKNIEVVAAIIKGNGQNTGKIFAAQRGYGEMKGGWEFPGGKVESGESRERALIREIKEELDTEIEVLNYLCTVEHDYQTFHLSMHCYICSVVRGRLELLEHNDAKWLKIEELSTVQWLPADIKVVEKLDIQNFKSYF